MHNLIQEASERTRDTLLDLGECNGFAYQGTRMLDFTDAEPCRSDAIVALVNGEWEGLVLCGKCYKRHQASAAP